MRSGEESHTSLKHFVGVVENRKDPKELGRVQVRIYGVHTEDKTAIPTADLPWATVVMPATSASISGVGRSPTGIVEGSWVFGVLVDEREYQTPMILGTLYGSPQDEADIEEGFYDPSGTYPLDKVQVHGLGESSVTRLARGVTFSDHQNAAVKEEGKELLGTVESALASKVNSLPDKDDAYYKRTTWVEPWPRYGGQEDVPRAESSISEYPFNHVTHTEGGHVLEVDDTPEGERLHAYHSKGTFIEIQPDGSRVTKVVTDDYQITLGDKDVYVKGNVNITVDGDVRQLIHGNKIEEIDGDLMQTIRGDHVKVVQGNEVKEILSDKNTQVNGNDATRISKNRDIIIVGNLTETVNGDNFQTINGDTGQSITVTADQNTLIYGNNAIVVLGTTDIGSGGNMSLATASKGTFESTGNMLLKTDANQQVTIGASQTVDITSNQDVNVTGNITRDATGITDTASGTMDINGATINLN